MTLRAPARALSFAPVHHDGACTQHILPTNGDLQLTALGHVHHWIATPTTCGVRRSALENVMHDTAMEYGSLFFKIYLKNSQDIRIVEVGSQDVSGSLRSVAPAKNNYIGVDFMKAPGVDIVLDDPYHLPFEDESVDVVVTSSCFEHSEFFWLVFNEILRILKPSGLLYINAPSNGAVHRYPVDCWRFYPDSGLALQNWGRRSGYNCALVESFTGLRKADIWDDYVAVFVKDENHISVHNDRMQRHTNRYLNGMVYGEKTISNPAALINDKGGAVMKLRSLFLRPLRSLRKSFRKRL